MSASRPSQTSPVVGDGIAQDYAAFCHRLGSPLGALVNHLYMLGMDADDLPADARQSVEDAQQSVGDLRALLDVARRRLDAHERSLKPQALTAEQVGSLLDCALPGDGVLHADPEALQTLRDDLAAHAQSVAVTWEGDCLSMTCTLSSDNSPTVGPSPTLPAPSAAHLLAPFAAPALSPRWACASVLVQRMGGRLDLTIDRPLGPQATLILPLAPASAL